MTFRGWIAPNAGREMLAILAIATIGLGYLGIIWQTRSPSLMIGKIISFGLVEQKGYGQVGSVVRVQAAVPDGRVVSAPLPNGSACRVGSNIEIEELHTLFGSRFMVGLRECSASAVSGLSLHVPERQV